jgi:hypothetical protein
MINAQLSPIRVDIGGRLLRTTDWWPVQSLRDDRSVGGSNQVIMAPR